MLRDETLKSLRRQWEHYGLTGSDLLKFGKYVPTFRPAASIFKINDGDSTFLKNVYAYLTIRHSFLGE
jgi:hypothetical protein